MKTIKSSGIIFIGFSGKIDLISFDSDSVNAWKYFI